MAAKVVGENISVGQHPWGERKGENGWDASKGGAKNKGPATGLGCKFRVCFGERKGGFPIKL